MTTEFQQLLGLLRMIERPVPGRKYSSKDLQPYLNQYITMVRYAKEKPIIMCNQILTKIKIGRASCRERVSSPV